MATRRGWALVVVAALAALIAGCGPASGNGAATGALPPAATLLADSAAATRAVHSTHFLLTVDGSLPDVPVAKAEGDLNAAGQATGTATLTELGSYVEVDFVLTGNVFYLKGPTGGYQRVPAATAAGLFDPSAILDPNRGVARVLASITGARTEGTASVSGTATYRVTGTVDRAVVAGLVPGLDTTVSATVWLATSGQHLPVKIEFGVPAGGDNGRGATIDVVLSKFNEPVSVTPPA